MKTLNKRIMKKELKRAMLKYLVGFINAELIKCLKTEEINLKFGTIFRHEVDVDLMRVIVCSEFYDDYDKLVPVTYYEITKDLPVLKDRYDYQYQALTSADLFKIYEYLKSKEV